MQPFPHLIFESNKVSKDDPKRKAAGFIHQLLTWFIKYNLYSYHVTKWHDINATECSVFYRLVSASVQSNQTSTYIQAMWTVHRSSPKSIIVSCRLTDNMAQGIHLTGQTRQTSRSAEQVHTDCKHAQRSDRYWLVRNHKGNPETAHVLIGFVIYFLMTKGHVTEHAEIYLLLCL